MAELHIYDFDGTLFRSPYEPAVWDGDWWNSIESLMPPCVPDTPGAEWWIAPTVAAARESIANQDVYAVLMTGRPERSGFRFRIPELLRQRGLHFDKVLLTPEDSTIAWKKRIINNLLVRFPQVDTLRIWEDRLSHIAEFRNVARSLGIENVFITHVKSGPRPAECESTEVTSKRPPQIQYLGVFLDGRSRALIADQFPYIHHKAKADHMTIALKPTADQIAMVGQRVTMKIVGQASDEKCQALVVEPSIPILDGRTPHITVSLADGVLPKYSNDLIARGYEPVDGPIVSGIVDTYPRSLTSVQRVALAYLERG